MGFDDFDRKLGTKFDRSGGDINGNVSMTGDMGLSGNLSVNSISVMDLIPIGAVLAYAGTAEPSNFLLCDGRSLSRENYKQLFDVIGTGHGTVDDDTFNIPDYRGRFLRGLDGSAARDPDSSSRTAMATGGSTGNSVGSLQDDSMQGHHHSGRGWSNSVAAGGSYNLVAYSGGGVVNSAVNTPYTDGVNGTPRTSSETRPLNAYVNYIIRYQ